MTRHNGRRYIIFGANGGIGEATARLLHADGARLMLVGGPSAEGLDTLSQALEGAPYESIDATSAREVVRACDTATKKLGGLDGMVHCLGSFELEPAKAATDDKIDEVLAVNLKSAIYMMREAERIFKKADGASVVFVSSAAAQRGMPNQELISAAKGGVEALTRSAAATMAPRVRVNAVAPGLIKTPLTRGLRENQDASDASKSIFPMQQFGTAEQVADAVAFLLDPAHAFITGQVLNIDGGLTTTQPKPRQTVAAQSEETTGRSHAQREDASDSIDRQVEFAQQTATE